MTDKPGISFPPDFVWGAATAAYQVEGAVHEDGRGESIWDRFSHTPDKVQNAETGDVACDHYHRTAEDVQLMQALNLNSYRLSVAWPRIVPDGGTKVNQPGIDFYNRLVDQLLGVGITPYVTLYHWDLPQPLEDLGGWLNRATADRFAYYADVISRALGDRVKHWITLNEPWCSAFLGYVIGVHAPGQHQEFHVGLKAAHTLFLGHGKAVAAVRANVRDAQVGIAINPSQAEPASTSPDDLIAARRVDGAQTRWYLDPFFRGEYPADVVEWVGKDMPEIAPGDMATIAAPLDFLGINFYNRQVVAHDPSDDNPYHIKFLHPDGEYTTMDWEVAPDSFYRLLARIQRDYHLKAIYITENGAAFADQLENGAVHDPRRVAYLHGHLNAVARAIGEGVPIKGYFVWSLLDNFEWAYGYSPRFGIVYVDYTNGLRRIVKDSGRFFAQVAKSNMLPILEPA
jgi:beta-glucosidase